MTTRKKYYAVKKGRHIGIFNSWENIKKEVSGYQGAIYKSFLSYEEAKEFVYGIDLNQNLKINNNNEKNSTPKDKIKKYYAVKVGLKPGIYNTWEECRKNVANNDNAVFKSFLTLEEAEDFMKGNAFSKRIENAIKRKNTNQEGRKKYYAVKKGYKIGIFNDWNKCKKSVNGYKGSIFKGFLTLEKAKEYFND
ncbi:hypothetical protein BCR32DRAFT_230304, partial [Anaeromyces robustus]